LPAVAGFGNKEHQQIRSSSAGLNLKNFAKRVRQNRQQRQIHRTSLTSLLREPFGEFDQNAPVGGIADLVKRNDEPQTFNHMHINMIFLEQPQQFLLRRFTIVCAHA
jgi:hypothetical protein